jgi:hypothetical protein
MSVRGIAPLVLVSLLPFALLATLNSAGYRYGASDLAFYGPAVMQRLDPRLFPRDTPVIQAQARLTLMDDTVAALASATGSSLPALFVILYLLSLALIACGAALVGASLYRHRWTIPALLAALTLRHAIAQSGTNTLEGYFHPRQLAFGLGVLAVAAFLGRRTGWVLLLLAAAASLHPTTTLWFAVWLGVATLVAEPRWRVPLAGLIAAAAGAGAWALVWGPLAGRLQRMDPEWLAAIADKDYLFPLAWSPLSWAINAGYVVTIAVAVRRRAAAGLLVPRERALAAGCLALAAVFVLALPFNAARVALAIQLQFARVFWMLDFLAVVYVVWLAAEGMAPSARRAQATCAVLLIASIARGAYVMRVLFPDRPIVQVRLPENDWGRAMRWARDTPIDTGWLASPMHASEYGTSVRMAAGRDVFVEALKDQALGMYDRGIAIRTRDRLAEFADNDTLTTPRARELAAEYDLDYYVTHHIHDLPVAYEAGELRIYRLR